VAKSEATETGGRFGSGEPIERTQKKQEQVRSQLLGEIAIGRFRPGDALPSEKRLAELLRISRHTIRRALGELERDGVVERLHGKGTFVVDRPSETTSARTPSFAVIVNEVSTGYYPSLLSAFEQASKKVGRPTIICNSNNDVAQQGDHLLHLLHNRVSGVALNPCSAAVTPAYQVQVAQDAGIPVVLLHRSVPDAKAPVLLAPEHQIGYQAAQMILKAGHRRVAFLGGVHAGGMTKAEQGFRHALEESAVDLPSDLVQYGKLKTFTSDEASRLIEEQLREWLKYMLSLPDPPTALFTSFDSLGEMIYLVAGSIGLRVPNDLSVVSYGGVRREGAIIRRLTAITIDEAEEARRAVQLLVEMSDGRRPICNEEDIHLSLGVSQGMTLTAPGD